MNRSAARSAVASALSGAGFDLIAQGAPDTFSGARFVAVITSASTERVQLGRDVAHDVNGVVVSIYVQRGLGGAPSVEDSLDDLSAAVIAAIDALDTSIVFARSDAGGGAAPNRRIDGLMYRHERIGFTVLDEDL